MKATREGAKGAWIVGFGYQARQLKEQRTPTIEELDTVSTDIPVLIVDSSGHLGAGNSAAFEAAGISGATPDPAGGTFARKADGKTLAGPMEETALNAVRARRPPFTGELADQVASGASRLWASYGQTTAMDCGVGLGNDDIALFRTPSTSSCCRSTCTWREGQRHRGDYRGRKEGGRRLCLRGGRQPDAAPGAIVAEANASGPTA